MPATGEATMEDLSTLVPAALTRQPPEDAVLAVTLLYHPDVSRIGDRAALEGVQVAISRTSPELAPPRGGPRRPIEDRYVSRSPLQITRMLDGYALTAPAVGGCVVNGRALAQGTERLLVDRASVDRGIVVELADRVILLLHFLDPTPPRRGLRDHKLLGESDAIARVRSDIDSVGDLPVPVLLRGETGTGKELVASAIHAASPRAARPWIAVNVAQLPASIAASVLFGSVKGTYTGATDALGLFARADGTTLFLDEIGETPYDAQPMLLRALETGEVTPVGGPTRLVDVRLVTATDADLENQISEQGFREALFHRLAGYQMFVPSLRERRDDLGRLFVHFLGEALAITGDLARLEGQAESSRLWLPTALMGRLARYAWPGNVRQLRNAARQLAIASRGRDEARIDVALDRLLTEPAAATPAPSMSSIPANEIGERRDPSTITDEDLVTALRSHGWRADPAARRLGVSRSTLYKLIDRSPRIRKAKEIPEAELRRVYEHCGDVDAAAALLEVSSHALKLRLRELELDA
jgi:two-component system, NtrC family, nitrogen regulation response regulator GlnG